MLVAELCDKAAEKSRITNTTECVVGVSMLTYFSFSEVLATAVTFLHSLHSCII